MMRPNGQNGPCWCFLRLTCNLITFAEWAAAFRRDPRGKQGRVLPVRIERCEVGGLLGPIVYIDLVDLYEQQAREHLLAGVKRERAKPVSLSFPGSSAGSLPLEHTVFPGALPQEPSFERPLGTRRKENEMHKIKVLFLAAN